MSMANTQKDILQQRTQKPHRFDVIMITRYTIVVTATTVAPFGGVGGDIQEEDDLVWDVTGLLA